MVFSDQDRGHSGWYQWPLWTDSLRLFDPGPSRLKASEGGHLGSILTLCQGEPEVVEARYQQNGSPLGSDSVSFCTMVDTGQL